MQKITFFLLILILTGVNMALADEIRKQRAGIHHC